MKSLLPYGTSWQGHISLAHYLWSKYLQPGDTVIDATCGNGYDTLFLAEILAPQLKNKLMAIDIQKAAIEAAKERLKKNLPLELFEGVEFFERCHSMFPEAIRLESVKLIVYNLGYLPTKDKSITTQSITTIQSLTTALPLISNSGAISITCYPGHPAGYEEQKQVVEFARQLDPQKWVCCHHCWLNKENSPTFLWLQRL